MQRFRYRALVDLDHRGGLGRAHPSTARRLLVHARRIDQPSEHKYFPATISPDDQQPLEPGDHVVVTITVTGDDAPLYLASGQQFTIWGDSTGHGVISRRVPTDGGTG